MFVRFALYNLILLRRLFLLPFNFLRTCIGLFLLVLWGFFKQVPKSIDKLFFRVIIFFC